MDDNIKALAHQRRDGELLEQNKAELLRKLENCPLWQSYLEVQTKIIDNKAAKATLEAEIKAGAVDTFDGENKNPHPMVSIGEYSVLEYEDTEALAYCIEHNMPSLVNLNKSAFNKAAKAGIFEFVTIKKEPRARIAADLSTYLD